MKSFPCLVLALSTAALPAIAQPQPMLLVARPDAAGTSAPYSAYLLVQGGKHGAQAWAASRHVRRSLYCATRDGVEKNDLHQL